MNDFASLVFRSGRIVPTKKLLHHDVKDGKNEEHIERLVAYLMLAVEICTDNASGTYEKLEEGVRQRTGIQAPHIEDAFAHPLPRDAAVLGILTAYRAVVSPEHVTAVGTTMLLLFLVGIVIGFVLPSAETSECFFQVHALENKTEQNPEPVGGDAGAEASDGVGSDGFADEVAVAEAVEHGGVGGEVAAPAHAHGGEDGYGVVVDNAFRDEAGDKTKGSTHGAESGDGERDEGTELEAEEPVEDHVDFVGQHGDDGDTLVGGTGIFAMFARRTKGEHHDHGGDTEHAGDDGEADVDALLATVEHTVEETLQHTAFALVGNILLVAFGGAFHHRGIHLGVALEGETLHEAGRDDAADKGAKDTHSGTATEALAYHEGQHHEAHAKGSAEIGEGDELVLLEILGEVLVVSQGDDGGIVGEESHDCAQSRHTGQIVKGFHEGTQDVLHESHNTELDKQFADTTHQDADGHDVEDGLEQELVGCLHKGVEHVGQRHVVGEYPEEAYKQYQEQDGLDGAFAGELEGVLDVETTLNAAKEFLGPVGILGGFVFTMVVKCHGDKYWGF